MPKRTRRNSAIKTLYITKDCHRRLLMWAQSRNEINFICGGHGNEILHVERIRNISVASRNFAEWNNIEYKQVKLKIKSLGYKIIAKGHSHPQAFHNEHPSSFDVHLIPTGQIELIVFPNKQLIRAWMISNSMKKTLHCEFEIKFYLDINN